MRVVSWNVHRATKNSPVWNILKNLNPDIVFLQEYISLPEELEKTFAIKIGQPINKNGKPQNFKTAVLVRGKIIKNFNLHTHFNWVNEEIKKFSGNLLSCVVKPIASKHEIKVIGVYSPAWVVGVTGYPKDEVNIVKRKQNNYLWVDDLLREALKNENNLDNERWIIGGDFNASETMDYLWKNGPHGNLEHLGIMQNIGFIDCLRHTAKGRPVPTFKDTKKGMVINQLDYIYANNLLFRNLINCWTGRVSEILDKNISDHLPVIADFK